MIVINWLEAIILARIIFVIELNILGIFNKILHDKIIKRMIIEKVF